MVATGATMTVPSLKVRDVGALCLPLRMRGYALREPPAKPMEGAMTKTKHDFTDQPSF